MRDLLIKLYMKAQLFHEDNGEESASPSTSVTYLIEYALVAALIALAATAGTNTVASDINSAFTSIGTKVTNYT